MRKTARWPLAAALFLSFAHPGLAARMRDDRIEVLSHQLFPALTASTTIENGIAAMLAERRRRLSACGEVSSCLIQAAHWSEAERDLLADALDRNPPRALTIPDDGVRAQILREVNGLNRLLDVYGLGAAPRYPEIDGPGPTWKPPERMQPADDGIALALSLLEASGRDDAAAFEPLDERYNAPALDRARSLDWSRYTYTAIIVPGVGPDDLATPLSARGSQNVDRAAARFFDGVAPFIIVTGGAVHPRGTKHVEALEMRQALIDRGVPADCIVTEPYARHTTTNLRNATRRLAALGAPFDRDALIVTNPEQSRYIEGANFAARNQRELGYQPGMAGTRLSPSELTFRPAKASLRVDPMDPLDP